MNFLSIFSIFSKKGGGGGGGTDDYDKLKNQPYMNNKKIQGNHDADYYDLVQKSTFLNTIYPKGTVKWMFEKKNPSTFLGGVWELIDEGYYPISQVQEILDEESERYLNAELPNIKGSWGGAAARSMRNIDGAFKETYAVQHGATWGGSGNDDHVTMTEFDASNGQVDGDGNYISQEESVYKDGGKVQPKSVKMYIYRRTDDGILTYNFVNISFSASDFGIDEQGRIYLKNSQYVYTKDMLVSANDAGTLISTNININDIVLKQRKVAGISLDHDITEQELQDAIKEITAVLKNKTINADNNTILNLTIDNFKDGEVRTSVRDADEADDIHFVTEKAVRDAIIEAVTGLFKIKGNKETIAEIEALIGTEDYEAWTWREDGHLYYWLVDKWLDFPLININDFVKKADKKDILYGTGSDKKQLEYEILHALKNSYFYKWEYTEGSTITTHFTNTINDGTNIDIYDITFEDGKVKTITKSSSDGTITNGVLFLNSVGYIHAIDGDGLYIIDSDKKIITADALTDLLEMSGKVNDVKLANKSIVENKVANIETIDNVEDNFYYAFKNGSTYYYTKSKATGSTAYYQFTYTDNVLTKIENKGNVTVELNSNMVPQITISSVVYTLDGTKNDYYIINPKQKLPSIENETRNLTEEE